MADTDTFTGWHLLVLTVECPAIKLLGLRVLQQKKDSDIALKNTIIKSNSMKSKLHRGAFLHRDKSQKEGKYQISTDYAYIQRGPIEGNKDRFLLTT